MNFFTVLTLLLFPVAGPGEQRTQETVAHENVSTKQRAADPEDLPGRIHRKRYKDRNVDRKVRCSKADADHGDDSALLWFPRILLWPFRAVFEIIAKPALALVEWGEESGFTARAGRTIRSPDGRLFPSFAWTMHKKASGGVYVALPEAFGENGVLSAKVMGGANVWEGFARLSIHPFKNVRFAVEGRAWDRDDYRIRLPAGWVENANTDLNQEANAESARSLFVAYRRRYLETGATGRARLSKRAAVDLGVFYVRDDYGLAGNLATKNHPTHLNKSSPAVFPWSETGFHGVEARIGAALGGIPPFNSWNGSSIFLRRHPGPGGAIWLTYFHSFDDGGYRVLQGGGDAWWTLALPRGRGFLTAWAGFRYLADLGKGEIPPPRWIHLGGNELHRGMREGFQTGTAAGLAGLEYSYPILTDFWGIVFLDWGQATDRSFENWRWSMDMTSIGARIEWEIIKEWRLFIQVGFSKEDRIIGAGLGKGS